MTVALATLDLAFETEAGEAFPLCFAGDISQGEFMVTWSPDADWS